MSRESIAELPQSSGVSGAQNAVVQSLESNPFLGQLSLDVLMPVDAKLGVVGEVGAELEEERTEVLVDAIEVVMIDHGRAPHDPGIRLTGLGIAAFLGTEDRCFLLSLTHHDNPLSTAEARPVLLRDVVLALAFCEGDQSGICSCCDEAIHRSDERLAHGVHRRR